MSIFWIVLYTVLGIVQIVAMVIAWGVTVEIGTPPATRWFFIIFWPILLALVANGVAP